MSAHQSSGSAWQVHGLMLGAAFLVATSFPVVAAITGHLDSGVLTFIRFALATALFGPVVACRYGLSRPNLRDLLRYSLLSFLLVTFFWCMFTSLRLTTPLNTAAIFALNPFITAAVAAVLLHEKMSLSARVLLPIGAVGATWIVFRGDLSAFLSLRIGAGDIFFLAGTIALATYTTLVKVLHRGEPMAQMTFWILATGTIWLFLLTFSKLNDIQWATVPGSVWVGITYLSIFTTIVTFFVFQWSTTRIGPTRVAAYTFLNPALVLLIGLTFGDIQPPLTTWPGVFLVVGVTVALQTNLTGGAQKPRSRSGKAARNWL
ncbi:DMT family transporter [Ruegeria sp. SCP11]|uniref:DMT family transporter n=1 Tax=Ruegeria sp. SCP11 TaxID=3141378 RepID=UPI00333A0DE3